MHELTAILAAAADLQARGTQPVLATVVDVKGSVYRRPGAHMLIGEGMPRVGSISGGCLERDVIERAAELLQGGAPQLLTYDSQSGDDIIWGLGLGCNGVVAVLLEPLLPDAQLLAFWRECLETRRKAVVSTVFASKGILALGERFYGDRWPTDTARALAGGRSLVTHYADCSVLHELVSPRRRLVVCGAGPDAMPVVRIAKEVGWEVTVVDRRRDYARRELFPEADHIIVGSTPPGDLTSDDAAVVMAHHYEDDRTFLSALLDSSAGYIGVLGPQARTVSFLEQLRPETKARSRIYAPVGLDIGAETPEAIAISIVAEMTAATSGRPGGCLRERSGPIHVAVET